MNVRFWGTRGSLAKPGPTTLRYGGNTSCVEARADDGVTELFLAAANGSTEMVKMLLARGANPAVPRSGQPPRQAALARGQMDAAAALEIVQRRGILLRRVRQQGALTLEVDPRGLSTALVNRYLEVKERNML